MAKSERHIPGYKIVLRILIIVLVLGGVGALVFYFVGGFTNNKKAYELYQNNLNSAENVYFDKNFKTSDVTTAFCRSHITNFTKWYNAYETEKCVFDELSPKLYFSTSDSSTLNNQISNYFKSVSNTSAKIAIFLNRREVFEGGGITAEETAQLVPLANDVFVAFKNQIKNMEFMNDSLVDFTKKYCLGNGNASQKELMISLLHSQSKLLVRSIETEDENLQKVTDDNNAGLVQYKTFKENNFVAQTQEGSDAFNMMLSYDKIYGKAKTGFLDATDKDAYLASLAAGSIDRIYLEYVKNVMGWGE